MNHVWLSFAGSLHAHQTVKHSTARGRCFYSAASPPSPSPSLLQCFVFHNIDPLMFSWWSALCWSAFSPTADGVLPVISTCSGLRARVFFCNIFYSLQKSEWDVGCTLTRMRVKLCKLTAIIWTSCGALYHFLAFEGLISAFFLGDHHRRHQLI